MRSRIDESIYTIYKIAIKDDQYVMLDILFSLIKPFSILASKHVTQ